MRDTRWIIEGTSTLDDTKYGPIVVQDYPTLNNLIAIAEEWGGPSDSGGSGDYGTNVRLKVDVVNVELR